MYATGFPVIRDRFATRIKMIQGPIGKCGLEMRERWCRLATVTVKPVRKGPYRADKEHETQPWESVVWFRSSSRVVGDGICPDEGSVDG